MAEQLLSEKAKDNIRKLKSLTDIEDAPPFVEMMERAAKAVVTATNKCTIDKMLSEYANLTRYGEEVIRYDTNRQNMMMPRLPFSSNVADTVFSLHQEMFNIVSNRLSERCGCQLSSTRTAG
uniref:Uncharacterized protein n=1 Tax=viral metagenome TaxID=1070528 RepID=A0A6M3M702_9ZZZZ